MLQDDLYLVLASQAASLSDHDLPCLFSLILNWTYNLFLYAYIFVT